MTVCVENLSQEAGLARYRSSPGLFLSDPPATVLAMEIDATTPEYQAIATHVLREAATEAQHWESFQSGPFAEFTEEIRNGYFEWKLGPVAWLRKRADRYERGEV